MIIYVDSDSCPATVRELVVSLTGKIKANSPEDDMRVVFTANREIPFPDRPHVSFHLANKDKDSADNYILSQAKEGDVVLTKDFLLARKSIEQGVVTINFDGRVFDLPWLKKRIEERDLMEVLYKSGSINRYKKKSRDRSQDEKLRASLKSEIGKIRSKV